MATKTKSAKSKDKAKTKAPRGQSAAQKKVRAERSKAAKERREAARKEAIEAGRLIVGQGGVEFHRVEEKSKNVLDERAAKVLAKLEKAKTPVLGKDIQEEFGGSWPLYIPMFSMLKAQGLVVEFRRRTGARGGGGVAYLHTDHIS